MQRKSTNERDDFLRRFGRKCRKCGKYTISSSAAIQGNNVERKAICDNCGHTWKI